MSALMKVVEAMEEESRQWFIVCGKCGAPKSVAGIGGIRYKAASVGKRTLVWCSTCQSLRIAKFEKRSNNIAANQTKMGRGA